MILELSNVAEFSRCHCVGICAALIPMNLLLNSATILLSATGQSPRSIYLVASLGILPALALILHVASWWAVGVVMLPTYILPLLAITCLSIDAYAIFSAGREHNYFKLLFDYVTHRGRDRSFSKV
jgi:hypothetical protein